MCTYKSLKCERCKEIDEIADTIRGLMAEEAVNVEAIVRLLRGRLIFKKDYSGSLDAEVIQISTKEPSNLAQGEVAFELIIEQQSDSLRKRFALAKGLGRVILHMKYLQEGDEWNLKSGPFYQGYHYLLDEEAEYFAYCLLMPYKVFCEAVEKGIQIDGGAVDTQKLAQVFKVRNQDVIARGISLGLFGQI